MLLLDSTLYPKLLKPFSHLQAECTYNREKFDSFGRRRRRSIDSDNANNAINATNADLTLSQEILVLDFNEELPSNVPKYSMPSDPLDSNYIEPNPAFNTNFQHRRPQPRHHKEAYGPSYEREYGESCPTRNSVLVLSVVCGMLLLLYIASAVCFMAKNRPWRGSHMGHNGHHKHIIQ